MITIRESLDRSNIDVATFVKTPMTEVRCLSTDSKPTNVPNGSMLTEINTGKTYVFDATNSAWSEVSSGGGGGGESVPDNDVTFIDYDGTILHSYTKAEFLALTEMPANPSHSGLTAQGWNWTLADAKAEVTASGELIIGQNYITSDGATKVYVSVDKNTLNPMLGIKYDGKVTVDWGDGTTPDTETTNALTVKEITHTYSEAGDYVISITPDGETVVQLEGNNTTQTSLFNGGLTDYKNNTAYPSCIEKVEIGKQCRIGTLSFRGCFNLKSVTLATTSMPAATDNMQMAFRDCTSLKGAVLPSGADFITNSQNVFNGCYSLERVSLPKTATTTQTSLFDGCFSMKKITFPTGVTYLAQRLFYNCKSLQFFEVQDGVTTIDSNAFYNCTGLMAIKFKPTTPPTVSGSTTFNNLFAKCKIYVPTGTLSDYTTETNYPSSLSYDYIEY